MEHLTRFPRGEGGWGTPTYWLLVFEPRDFEDPDPYIGNNVALVGIVFTVSSIDTVLQFIVSAKNTVREWPAKEKSNSMMNAFKTSTVTKTNITGCHFAFAKSLNRTNLRFKNLRGTLLSEIYSRTLRSTGF